MKKCKEILKSFSLQDNYPCCLWHLDHCTFSFENIHNVAWRLGKFYLYYVLFLTFLEKGYCWPKYLEIFCIKKINTINFFFQFSPWRNFVLATKEKNSHALSEYIKVKYIRDNINFWYIFMDGLFHQFLEDFWKIFGLVYCQVLFKYICFVFNRFSPYIYVQNILK